MNVLVSFVLSLSIYFLILFFLFSILQFKKPKKEEVLVHTAIVVKEAKKVDFKKKVIKKQVKKVVKSKAKKLKTKSNFTKGGENIKFDDIFKSVNYNVKTDKVKQKAQLDMSRLKGVEQKLNKIENLNINISVKSNTSKKVDSDKITKELSKVWDEISSINGEYAIIRVISNNGVKAYILDTNLEKDRVSLLVSKIESLNFKETFDITVKFQTKGN